MEEKILAKRNGYFYGKFLHKQYSTMNSYACIHQYWSKSKNSYSLALCCNWIPSRGLTKNEDQ